MEAELLTQFRNSLLALADVQAKLSSLYEHAESTLTEKELIELCHSITEVYQSTSNQHQQNTGTL